MVVNEVFLKSYYKQAASELAAALINYLPSPNECRHKFSDKFEEKMRSLIRGIGTKCYTRNHHIERQRCGTDAFLRRALYV